jgi:hypothetical protein
MAQPDERLQARLRELQELYTQLADKQADARPLADGGRVDDVWDGLYKPYLQWLRWNYLVPSEVVPLLYFNVAVDVHAALEGKEGYAMTEPVLAWLPQLLQAGPGAVESDDYTAEEVADARPLWGMDRLRAFLEAQPRQLLLDWHATPRGLLGGQRPRCIPPYKLANLVKAKGFSPPPPPNFLDSVAMLRGEAPLDIDKLFYAPRIKVVF